MSTPVSQLATAALDTLHGARSLPAEDAIAQLRASDALRILVSRLETEGAATDDDWQHAIETMLSLANDTI
jgi:hypothetical protein